MYETHTIVLSGSPLSTQHIYGQRGKIRYMKKEAKIKKEQYIREIKEQFLGKQIITGDVHIDIQIYFPDKRKRDRDNYHKIAIDSLSGIVIEDDVQIQVAYVSKDIDKLNPRYVIQIASGVNPDI